MGIFFPTSFNHSGAEKDLIYAGYRAVRHCSDVAEWQNYQISSESFRPFTLFRQNKKNEGQKLSKSSPESSPA